MADYPSDEQKIELTKEYFRRADAGRPDLLDLFHEDALFYFPKFGVGHGRDSVPAMVAGFGAEIESIEHDFSDYLFIASGPNVAVEGTTRGQMNGKSWEAGKTPGGRFCNIFEFRGDRFSRVFVYLDPDYTGEDEARFRWGKEDRSW